jgi:hypothetical protein
MSMLFRPKHISAQLDQVREKRRRVEIEEANDHVASVLSPARLVPPEL